VIAGNRRCTLSTPIAVLLILSLQLSSGRTATNPASARVPVEEFQLDNGMRFLLVQRPEATTVSAGWVARAGSADDQPDATGLSHLLEHLLFKGSRTIGSRDLEQELSVLERQDRVWNQLMQVRDEAVVATGRKKEKLERKVSKLQAQLTTLQEQASSLSFLGQFSFLYSEQGATGLNANTFRDFTLYYVTVPSEKLESWFWLESDRLLEPVFRELYKEVQVVHEERRLRIESTPTGRLDEELRGRFWGDHPYSWDVQGQPGDLDRIGRADAQAFFDQHYRSNNLTAALVGGFDPEQVRTWAQLYFGRLPRRPSPVTAGAPAPIELRQAESRMSATCECPPQVQVLYPSPQFGHPDEPALQVLAAVMNGRTGRLYRSLVLAQRIAFSAYSRQVSWRQAGEFSFRGETKGSTDPEELVSAWDRQLRLLQTDSVSDGELRRAKNRLAGDAFRSLKYPSALMKQLLVYQGLGDWRHLNDWPDQILAVSAPDVKKVASLYLVPQHRTIALYRRNAATLFESDSTDSDTPSAEVAR
jgi:predicted Zn-dependent peptidase